MVRDIPAFPHALTHGSLPLPCAQTSGAVLCDRDTCQRGSRMKDNHILSTSHRTTAKRPNQREEKREKMTERVVQAGERCGKMRAGLLHCCMWR